VKEVINILFAESDPGDAEIIWRQIENENIRFRKKLIDNREEYLDTLKTQLPDIIISAYSLNGFNGLDALEIRNELAPRVPFILVTGKIDEIVAVDIMKAGADDYLMKKNLSRLGEAIKSAIRKKEILVEKEDAERKLRESEEKYRLLVDLSPDAILVHMWGRILFANATTLKLLGTDTIENVKDIDLFNFVHPDYRDRTRERIKKIYDTGTPQSTEAKYINLKNEIIDVEVVGIPVKYMGKPAIQSIIRDITQRKHVEEELIKSKEKAEESDQLKTAFLHNISHEIRTPMNAIAGFSALLEEPDLNPETVKSYLKIITDSSDQLLSIVNDIIEISNIEVGILKAFYNEINLNSELMMIYQQFRKKAVDKGIEFRLQTSLFGEDAEIEIDNTKLNQILSNLLSNAFKFTKDGKITFGYELKNRYLEFFVSDTGIGIHPDHFEKIFERFFQVDNSVSRGYEGTGLGLAIAKAYVEFLGGKIWLNSEPGKGSIFYFTLPYKSIKQQQLPQMETKDKNQPERRKSILIAEDDDNNFYLMKELLSDLNINIIRASNGAEAVNAFKSGKDIDLVLMDIKMPVMDGYEATRQILEEKPEAKILAQTAYADDEIKAMESGCMGFISKPFIKDRFVSLVKEYL
jgi:PAS domain S-box-containing protein